jgi:gliding motility-associated-like protein
LLNIHFSNGQVQLEPACAESVEYYGVTGFEDSQFLWYFDHSFGQIIDGEGTDTVAIRWFYKTGTVEMEVLEVTSEGCSNVPSRATLEIMAPYVYLGPDFPEICDQDTLLLTVGNDFQPPYEILWYDGSVSESYYATHTEQIWVRVVDGYGCFRYDTVSLLVHPLPEVNLGQDTILCDKLNPFYLDPGDFASYDWETSMGIQSNASYLDIYPTSVTLDTIFLTVTDYNECSMSDTLVILPCDLEVLFRGIFNTITPNGDGENDVWNIPYMDFFDDAVLEIFDRWGRLVYRTTNVLEEPWDGTSAGRDLPMDSYYYVLNLNMLNTPPIVGTVNLIR